MEEAFGTTISKTEDFTTLAFSQLGGSCTAVVLERDLKETVVVEPTQQETAAQQITIIVSADKTSYENDDIVTLSGTLKDGDLLLAGREVKLTLELLLDFCPTSCTELVCCICHFSTFATEDQTGSHSKSTLDKHNLNTQAQNSFFSYSWD